MGPDLSDAEFRTMVLRVAVTGLVAFGACAALVWAFWKSLAREDAEGSARFTRRSAVLLVLVVAALIAASIVFVRL